MNRGWMRAAFAAAMLFGATAAAQADTYPARPVTIVVPYPAGGATDMIAREVSQRLGETWKQPVVVENRAGAGTTIGAGSVARAKGDGHTLLMTTSAHTISGHLYKGLPYDPQKDFRAVTLVTKVPLVLVVNNDLPVKTLPELLEYLKTHGEQVNFASPGNGTAQHLSGELFKIRTKSGITHVPYRGDAPAITDLMGGQVQMMLATATAVLPMIDSGKLRALAVAHDRRIQALSDVPTFAEAGMPDFEAATWFGLLAPASVDDAVVEKVYRDVSALVDTPQMRKRIEDMGGDVMNSGPADFEAFMREESEKWGNAVQASGASLQN
ncbi:tripartite tricarboxylate transporter substrate binding protein [Orrella sp. JC864]|uniref:Bug family tripartite tricarboxylate transporter substrate binding protein n=1 Tax=Orrella sp. JC864 TaxID=3120298 RepID=UPI0012BBE2FE